MTEAERDLLLIVAYHDLGELEDTEPALARQVRDAIRKVQAEAAREATERRMGAFMR